MSFVVVGFALVFFGGCFKIGGFISCYRLVY